jgi:hypothetical protein
MTPEQIEEAERLLSYWEIHGDNPEVVTKWAMSDMLPFLRDLLPESSAFKEEVS